MKRLTGDEVVAAFQSLKDVPRLPSYAQDAIQRLEQELWAARAAEDTLGNFRDTVAEAVRSTDPLRGSSLPYCPGDVEPSRTR